MSARAMPEWGEGAWAGVIGVPHLRWRGGTSCYASPPGTWLVCTRRAGHTGRHAVAASDYVVAVWP